MVHGFKDFMSSLKNGSDYKSPIFIPDDECDCKSEELGRVDKIDIGRIEDRLNSIEDKLNILIEKISNSHLVEPKVVDPQEEKIKDLENIPSKGSMLAEVRNVLNGTDTVNSLPPAVEQSATMGITIDDDLTGIPDIDDLKM